MVVSALPQLPLIPEQVARVSRLVLVATLPFVLVPALLPGLDVGGGLTEIYKHWIVNVAILGAAASTGLRAVLVRAERLAWSLLALALGSYGVGQVYWAFWLEPRAEPPFPSVCDALWLALYPLGCVALVLLARQRLLGRPEVWLDGIVGGAALAAIGEAIVFSGIVDGTAGLGTLGRTIALAYPIGDLVLIATVAGVFALTGWRPGTFWLLLGGGFALVALADSVYTAMLTAGITTTTTAINALWTLGLVTIGVAAWATPRHHRRWAEGWRVLAVPSAASALALATLVYGAIHSINLLATGLAALAIIGGIARAVFTFHDLRLLANTQIEALTDLLTGLGNRRRLMRDLDEALEAGEPFTLAVLDLDGFKLYNDRFGHAEGDLMLSRLARRLATAVSGYGRAYRLGGDEFCVLVSDSRKPDAVVDTARVALHEAGDEFAIECSCGVARVPAEEKDAEGALRLADSRMYAEKNSRPEAAKHQAADVAIGILAKAYPMLGRHVDDVAELCVSVGRELGLSAAELDDLAQAADLHDVGKVAIPARILDKPGPLDDDEWTWMRRHTLIGERMLAVAPALRHVATIVRSTHERFDGTGYPDGLAGQDILLAARIIAVCDSYDAMTNDRVYRNALPREEAFAELERGAGTQFDPTVVAAFFAFQSQEAAA